MVTVKVTIAADVLKSVKELSEQMRRQTLVPCYVVQECDDNTHKVVYYDSMFRPDVIHVFKENEREQAYQIAGDLQAALSYRWGVNPLSDLAWEEMQKPKPKLKVRIKGRKLNP